MFRRELGNEVKKMLNTIVQDLYGVELEFYPELPPRVEMGDMAFSCAAFYGVCDDRGRSAMRRCGKQGEVGAGVHQIEPVVVRNESLFCVCRSEMRK